ncbi:uncharacterized protein DFL_003072 [Arthrobotrys flagrans]|uniref:Uncharacterized protein n=1 Tax=Arthrobotrys flagrans TaxID=97331 RepID=A0A437ACB9_ARTFL|nr:hypothetical protein DFL_003072 [Arthrobotrys flagrans]
MLTSEQARALENHRQWAESYRMRDEEFWRATAHSLSSGYANWGNAPAPPIAFSPEQIQFSGGIGDIKLNDSGPTRFYNPVHGAVVKVVPQRTDHAPPQELCHHSRQQFFTPIAGDASLLALHSNVNWSPSAHPLPISTRLVPDPKRIRDDQVKEPQRQVL